MCAQRLSERKTRKIARETGLPVIRAWSHGGYVHDFVTRGHLHGWYSLRDGTWGISAGHVLHYTTCPRPEGWTGPVSEDQMFPDGVPPLTVPEARALLDAKAGQNRAS
jgi:hypothetical protein